MDDKQPKISSAKNSSAKISSAKISSAKAGAANASAAKASAPRTSPAEFFNQVKAEGRKVVWPSRQETIQTGIFVGVLMTILAVFFLGIDTLFGAIVRELLKLA